MNSFLLDSTFFGPMLQAGGYNGWNIVSTYQTKDEDNSLKNHNQITKLYSSTIWKFCSNMHVKKSKYKGHCSTFIFIYIYICVCVCMNTSCGASWCNGYHLRKWTQWHKFKSWTGLIAFHIALILLEKVWIQLFSLQLWVNSRTD